MPRPLPTLAELVRRGTFRSRRHRDLLGSEEVVHWPVLAAKQLEYRAATRESERKQIGVAFEKLVQDAHQEAARRAGPEDRAALLQALGPPGSAKQVANFFPRFLRWDDGSPFNLDPWQKDFIREAYRRDRKGRRVYKEILLGIPRGNGKTPLASGLALHALLASPERPRVFQAAGAKDQAALGLEYAHAWIDDGELADWLKPRQRGVVLRDGAGSYSVISAGGGLGHGRKPTIAIIDEWWAFTTYAQTQTFTAMETALHKLLDAYLLAISTAGFDKETQLGRAYDSAFQLPDVQVLNEGFLTVARDVEAGRLVWWYGMPDGYELDLEDDRAVLQALKLANPGTWVDHRELLRALRRTRDVFEWYRLALNAWTKVSGAWIPTGVWPGLRDEIEIPDGADIYVGVDAAHSYDTTAVVWAWKAPDGRVVLRSRVWSLRDEAPAHVHLREDSLDNEALVEPFIDQLASKYRIREIVADPNYFGAELRHLDRRYTTAAIYPNSRDMTEAVQTFYDAVLNGRVAYHPDDRVLTAHVEAIAGRKSEDGYWRIKKLHQTSPMDAGTAAILATSRAERHTGGGGFNIVFLHDLDDEGDEPDDE